MFCAAQGLGILAGLVLTTWFNETPLLVILLMSLLLTWLVLIGFTFIAGRDRSTRKAES